MDIQRRQWLENDALFFEECRKGQKWQEYIGKYLQGKGLVVEVPELSFRDNPNVADFTDDEAGRWAMARKKAEIARTEYINSKDLLLVPKWTLEVKSRNLYFTSPDDFPFGTVIVDTVYGYDQKQPKPALYICVSQKTGKAIATLGNKPGRWFKKKAFDKVRKIQENNYECPMEYWKPLDEIISSLKELQRKHGVVYEPA